MPKPTEWTTDLVDPSVVNSIKLKKFTNKNVREATEHEATRQPPITMQTWEGFVAWTESFGIRKLSLVYKGPQRIKAMLKMPTYKREIIEYMKKKAVAFKKHKKQQET